MSKKKKNKNPASEQHIYNSSWDRAEYEVTRMKLKDLQRACIGRGMDFELMVSSSIPDLHHWFVRNYDTTQDLTLINQFDDWKEQLLIDRGHDRKTLSPILRLGFIGERDEDGEIKSTKKPRLKGLKKETKGKKERVEGTKVFKGTKKALTYELTKKKLDKAEIVKQVIEAFPEAVEKSINIWIKKCQRESGMTVAKKPK